MFSNFFTLGTDLAPVAWLGILTCIYCWRGEWCSCFILWCSALKELLIFMLSKVTKINVFQKYKPSSLFVPNPLSWKNKNVVYYLISSITLVFNYLIAIILRKTCYIKLNAWGMLIFIFHLSIVILKGTFTVTTSWP